MPLSHTSVSASWEHRLNLARVLLACAGMTLYLLHPGHGWLPAMAGFYLLHSVALAFRKGTRSRLSQLPLLIIDLVFFCICALRSLQFGIWLSLFVYFFVLCSAVLWYEWRAAISMMVAALIFLAIGKPYVSPVLWPPVLTAGLFAAVLAVHRQKLQERLAEAGKQLTAARTEAENAREGERQRIADNFHDGPLQSFISFQMRLEIIRKLLLRDQEAAERELVELQDLGKLQVTDLRSFIRDMQPVDVGRGSLVQSLREVVDHFERDSGISATLTCGELRDHRGGDIAGELLQIVREALNNVRKHSKASRVNVSVEQLKDSIHITVDDDGSGFPFSGAYTLDELELLRLGPRSIKRRIRVLGGDLTLESRPSLGAGLRIRIPV